MSLPRAELRAALAATEPGARLVSPRLLRRVIRRHRGIGGFGREVPHERGYAIPGEELGRIVPPQALGPGPLPGTVLLLPEPGDEEATLTLLWRNLHEVRVLAAAEALALPATAIRERFHRIGQTEVDEIRAVLRRERLWLPPRPGGSRDEATFACFASAWADLRAFEPGALGHHFPTLAPRRDELDALLAADLPLDRLLEASRPPGAPSLEEARARFAPHPAPPLPPLPAEAREAARPRLRAAAARARARGNLVRAAILSARAGDAPDTDLASLGARLEAAIGRTPPDGERWRCVLAPLARRAAILFSPEGRLLYDLQKACVDHEREVHRIDLVEWALSLGRRPIRRSLAALGEARVARHLRRAAHRVPLARLADSERQPLAALLAQAVERRERRLRESLRPLLATALGAAVPEATTRVERVAQSKAVEELLDRIVERGKLDFPALRDAVARNQAKLADLCGAADFWRDALLRLDRDLAAPLEGVYRRAEVYRRWLQRFSALAFGTSPGRWLTRLAFLPAAGTYLVLEGLQHTVGLVVEKLADVEMHFVTLPSLVSVGVLLLALINSAAARRAALVGLRALWRGIVWFFADVPRWVLERPLVRRVLRSAAWRVLARSVLKPAVPAAALFGALLAGDVSLPARGGAAGGFFVALALLMSSAAGMAIEEAATDGLVRARRWLANRFFPALVRWILAVFRGLVEVLERVLYGVDEGLRFRPGDRPASIALKAALGLPWGALAYIVRFYVNVLIEPKYNPVKHFPVVTVAHKIILPMSLTLIEALTQPLLPLGETAAKAVAATTVFLLPGFFGFLAWELKENWRLYRRNRAPHLTPAIVGSHGETVARLLRPGFHSGTIPKLFAKLRRATRRAHGERSLHKTEEGLHHVEVEVHRFVERDLCALVGPALSPPATLEVRSVALGSNCIRIDVGAAVVSFEEQSGWLVASARGEIPEPLRRGLCGFYRLAGADLAREDVERALPPGAPYDVADEGLVVWPGEGYAAEVVYPLGDAATLAPRVTHPAAVATASRPLRREQVFLGPITWEDWVARWG